MAADTFEGKACAHGHGARRYVHSGKCVECVRRRSAARREVRQARRRERVEERRQSGTYMTVADLFAAARGGAWVTKRTPSSDGV